MTIQEFKDVVIEAGIMSVNQTETREHRIRGCMAGFEIAKRLNTPEEFEKELVQRTIEENNFQRMAGGHKTTTEARAAAERYIEFRCATLQIEHVYERMKVAWHYNHIHHFDSLSSRAVIQYAKIVGVGPLT
jgi:hypothetical protein